MAVQHRVKSVADLMRREPSPVEAHLISRAWAPRIPFRSETRPRSN